VRQYIARVGSGGGIDRYVSFVDVLNDPVLIDYECGLISETLRFVENAVILHHCSFEIAEEGNGTLIANLKTRHLRSLNLFSGIRMLRIITFTSAFQPAIVDVNGGWDPGLPILVRP
jgi:hypothetical protein